MDKVRILTGMGFSIRILPLKIRAPLAQRIRAFGCGPKGRAFESRKGRLYPVRGTMEAGFPASFLFRRWYGEVPDFADQ
jgi:hypothetical protein